MNRARWLFAAFLAFLAGLQVFSLTYYYRERRSLVAYLNGIASPSLPPSEQVKALVLSLKDQPDDENDAYFLCPAFRFLRATPLQVLNGGGDCADRSRLMVALLRLRGIHASKWALYNAHGEPKHAVVQVDIESGKMVADPLFGLWFPKPQGGYYAIRELRQDPRILLSRIDELLAKGQQPGADRLEFYPKDQYVYSQARTINWNKSGITRSAYWLFQGIMGEGVDELRRPSFVEEPSLMIVYGAAGLECVLVLAWFMMMRLKRRVSATPSGGEST